MIVTYKNKRTKVVPGTPSKVLQQTEEIDENTRNSTKLRGRETKHVDKKE